MLEVSCGVEVVDDKGKFITAVRKRWCNPHHVIFVTSAMKDPHGNQADPHGNQAMIGMVGQVTWFVSESAETIVERLQEFLS